MSNGSVRLDPTTKAAVASGRLVHLVTINPDGTPQVSCIYVGWDGDEIVSGHLGDYRKLHNIRRDPRVTLSVESDVEFTGFSPYLVVEGTARVTEGGAPDLLRRITTDQFGPDNAFPPPGDAPDGWVIHIQPHHIYGVGPWALAD